MMEKTGLFTVTEWESLEQACKELQVSFEEIVMLAVKYKHFILIAENALSLSPKKRKQL